MTSSSSRELVSDSELDTILHFAEESSTREIFPKETELTLTWLSGASPDQSSQKMDGTDTSEKSDVTYTSVDIKDLTFKRSKLGNDSRENSGNSKDQKNVETLQLGNDVSKMQRIENDMAIVAAKSASSTVSTVGNKRLSSALPPTAGGSNSSCEEEGKDGGEKNISDPVVAKVHRGRSVGTHCNCSYFCQLTGIMKLIEITCMLLVLIVTVSVQGVGYYTNSTIIVNGVILMALTVTPTLLLCYLLQQMYIQRTLFESIMNGLLALYSIVAGCSAFGYVMYSSGNVAVGVVVGVLLITAGVAYVVDCGLAMWKYRR